MTGTMKIAMIALIIISAAMMSGCLTDESSKDATLESMAKIDAIVNDPNYVDNEETRAAILAEMEVIDDKEYDLNSETNVTSANVTPTPEPKIYRIQSTMSQSPADSIERTGSLFVTVNGVLDFDMLEEVRIIVNNETIDVYSPTAGEKREIECNIIGEWNVVIEGRYNDNESTIQQIHQTRFNGIMDIKDAPNAGALGERYIEVPKGRMTREEAKALCDELGIVWGDERDC